MREEEKSFRREHPKCLSLFLNAKDRRGWRKGPQSMNQIYFVLRFEKIGMLPFRTAIYKSKMQNLILREK